MTNFTLTVNIELSSDEPIPLEISRVLKSEPTSARYKLIHNGDHSLAVAISSGQRKDGSIQEISSVTVGVLTLIENAERNARAAHRGAQTSIKLDPNIPRRDPRTAPFSRHTPLLTPASSDYMQEVADAAFHGHAVLLTTQSGLVLIAHTRVMPLYAAYRLLDPSTQVVTSARFGDFFAPNLTLSTISPETRSLLRSKGCIVHTSDMKTLEIQPNLAGTEPYKTLDVTMTFNQTPVS